MMKRAVTFAFALALATCTGCGSSRCWGSLEDVGQRCQRTFNGTPEQLPACSLLGAPAAGVCSGLDYLSLGDGTSCYYDPSSHQLVGAGQYGDYAGYCDGTSNTIVAGQVPESICPGPDRISRDCSATDAASEGTGVGEAKEASGAIDMSLDREAIDAAAATDASIE